MTKTGRKFPNQAYTRPAGLVRRLGAMMYDFLIIVAIWMLLGFARLPFLDQGIDAMNDRAGPGFQSILFLVTFGFFAFFWLRTGQTLGMLAWRIRIQTPEGCSISVTQSLMRFFAAGVSLLCVGLGYIWVLISPNRQTWHDRFSDSEVVYVPSDKEIAKIEAEFDLESGAADKASSGTSGKKKRK